MARRVLVVDDEVELAAVLNDLLELEGYEVAVCHDVASALEALSEGRFDAAMLDVFLSDGPTGLALASCILEQYPGTAVVLMTGYADTTDVEEACLSGVHACIAKPFDLDDVVRVVGNALETRRAA